ncbi:hypothetical protein Hdeb2414_s0018g00518191 [Helianthus debilis subsp. tardiflorus]
MSTHLHNKKSGREIECERRREGGQPPDLGRICRRFLSMGECCTPTYRAEDNESGEAVRARVLRRLRLTPARIPVSLDSVVCLFFQLDGSILCTLKLFSIRPPVKLRGLLWLPIWVCMWLDLKDQWMTRIRKSVWVQRTDGVKPQCHRCSDIGRIFEDLIGFWT